MGGLATRSSESEGAGVGRPFSSVARHNLASDVTRQLIKRVLEGGLRPGDQLPPENRLSSEFAVSRQVIREAMSNMSSLGLVITRQGKPAEMAPHESWNEFAPEILEGRRETGQLDAILLELLELRRLIEIEAVSLAAARATPADLKTMSEALIAMDGSLDDPAAYAISDIAFHQAILKGTRNRLLPLLSAQLRPFLEFTRELSARTRAGSLAVAHQSHRTIFDAIVAKDADAARTSMADHLSWTANLSFAELATHLAADGSSEHDADVSTE